MIVKIINNRRCYPNDKEEFPWYCEVTKEPGDKIRCNNVEARGESTLLHHIKKILNARGYDLIKKHMWKDGHLMADQQQYLRTRKRTGNPKKDIYIYNSMWNVQGADYYFNRDGKVKLAMEYDIFNVPEKK